MKVYLAAITHKQGINLYAGATKAELLSQLASYVREQGGPIEWAGSYEPESQDEIDAMSDEKVVELYFQDHPSEFIDEDSAEITSPGSIPHFAVGFDDSYRPQGTAISSQERKH
ncbi:hypothetical protein [Rhizobium laguerreae]|uniref:hypothetical protein n=1 Tax=Rhizobium laguerreae TaxID=1076926 RepID=UPI001C9056F4|nr:hypothetical protein [Rhizobium laguerreae]MBY3231822.1 hypothetical protein [Rhizobium laguerreae]